MSVYTRGAGNSEILIEDAEDGGVFAKITNQRGGGYQSISLPADERREAAQALAGPDCRVVPRDLTVGDLAQIARDAGVQLDMDLQESEPTDSETITVSWHDTVLIGPAIHAAKMLADSEDGGGITISEDGEALARLPLPKRRGTRLNLARLITPDGWTIVPSESATNAAAMQEDLRAILDTLGLGDHARPYSPHECVQRDVLPAIEKMQERARHLSAALADEQPDRPEPVDPASVRVGDYVEVVQQHDDVPLRITVEGEVYQLGRDGDKRHLFYIRGYGGPAIGDVTSVRILRRPEPEPDEAPMGDGYMDAAAVPVPDAEDDTLRLEIAAALILHDHPEQNALTRPDDPMVMLRADPTFFVCRKALARADALLPLIREHVAAAVQTERERVTELLQARRPHIPAARPQPITIDVKRREAIVARSTLNRAIAAIHAPDGGEDR